MNKDLYGKEYEVPTNILNNLKTFGGEKTINNILNSKKISYSNLKRIKNRMQNPEEKEKLGGDTFLKFIDTLLSSERGKKERSKQHKSEYGGLSNQFRKAHTNNTGKIDTKQDLAVLENLKQINDLIKKLNGGVVDSNYRISWQDYKNCILLTQHGDVKQLNTKIYKIVDL